MLGLLLALATAAQAQLAPANWKPIVIDQWGGLDLVTDSTRLQFNCQFCSNVLTENGYLEKRPGNVLLTTVLPGYAVTYASDWVAPSGSRYLVTQASQTIYQTNFSSVPVALSTISAGYNLTTAAGFSKLFFADGSRPLWQWDGTSTSTVVDFNNNAAPVCTYVAFKDSRLFCYNIPSEGSSRVRISSQSAGNFWTVPYNVAQIDNAPNVFDFNPSDGDYGTCMAATPWGMFLGKRNSTGILKGNGNLSYDLRILDPKIGCVDNRTVQMVYGWLVWLALDGVYAWNGAGPPQLVSRELDPLIKQVRALTYSEGQWATQLQPDWATGTESTTTLNKPALPWNYADVPGQIFPSSFTLLDNNRSALQIQTAAVGFASDTLVNIDTTSVPFDIGYAQLAPSTAGVSVWLSSFPAGSFTNMPTTWTVVAGAFEAVNPAAPTGFRTKNMGNNTAYTTAPSSGSLPSASGWNFGAWTMKFDPFLSSGGSQFGRCVPTTPATCFEFDIMADRQYGSAGLNGYRVVVAQSADCGPSTCAYSASVNKVIAGVSSGLGTGSFTMPYSVGSDPGYSVLAIIRKPDGTVSVYINNAVVVTAKDNTSAATVATVANLNAISYAGGGYQSYVQFSTIAFSAYGSGSIISRTFDTGATVPLAGAINSSYTLTSDGATSLVFKVRGSNDGNTWPGWTTYTNSQRAAALDGKRYWQTEEDFVTTVASETPKLQSIQIQAATTGYYFSKVDFLGSGMTAWKQLGISETNPGTYGYAVRVATYPFPAGNYALAWTTQAANTNITLATATYAQFRLDSTGLTSADQAEPISAVFLRWGVGANIPLASASLDRRYLLCVAVSTGATTPDVCLLRQKNSKWVYWSNGGQIGGLGQWNYNIVAVDGSTSSKVWTIMQKGVYQDDGSPIDAQWVSGDFTDGGLVFNNKVFHEAWGDFSAVAASSVTFSFAMDKSSLWIDKVISLDAPGAPSSSQIPLLTPQTTRVNKWIPLSSGYATGKYLRFKLDDSTLNSYLRANAVMLYVEDEQRTTP